VLEAFGAQVIPLLRPLYDHEDDEVAFHAARAGARLGDREADSAVFRFARKDGSIFQALAIETLGRCPKITRADMVLRELLDSDDNLVRLAAYEALLRRRSSAVLPVNVGGQFHLDIVRCSTNDMIYATHTTEPRVALFGENISVVNPVFYNQPGDVVTINAHEGSEQLTLWRSIPGTDAISDKFNISFDVISLVRTLGSKPEYDITTGEIKGLGLTYGQVVSVLYGMCKQDLIDARFVLETLPDEQEMLRRVEGVGGPESDDISADISSP
jgi:hypothetical protein